MMEMIMDLVQLRDQLRERWQDANAGGVVIAVVIASFRFSISVFTFSEFDSYEALGGV